MAFRRRTKSSIQTSRRNAALPVPFRRTHGIHAGNVERSLRSARAVHLDHLAASIGKVQGQILRGVLETPGMTFANSGHRELQLRIGESRRLIFRSFGEAGQPMNAYVVSACSLARTVPSHERGELHHYRCRIPPDPFQWSANHPAGKTFIQDLLNQVVACGAGGAFNLESNQWMP